MVNRLKYIIILVSLLSIAFGQLKSDLNNNSSIFDNPIEGSSGIGSLFDQNRFSMNHSFSMSMLSMGKQSVGVASYTNNMNFNLRDNLRLQTYLTFMQPQMLTQTNNNPYSNSQVYFNAALDYNPTPNTHLKISFGNYPQYRSYYSSPLLFNRPY